MANIDEYLEQILTARYGRDVRDAIHDSIEEINNVCEGNVGAVQTLVTQATNAKNSAVSAKNDAVSAKNDAQSAMTSAQSSASNASSSASTATDKAQEAAASQVIASDAADRAEAALEGIGSLNGLFQIDLDGHLIVGDLTGFGGTFSIDRSTGHLLVAYS